MLVVSVDVLLLIVIMYQVIDSNKHFKLIQDDHENAKKADFSINIYSIATSKAHIEIINIDLSTATNIVITLKDSKGYIISSKILIRNPYTQTGFIQNIANVNLLPNKD